jgi:hypothetical protein
MSSLPLGAKLEQTFLIEKEAYLTENYTDLGSDKFVAYVYKKKHSGGNVTRYEFCAAIFKNDIFYNIGFIDDLLKNDDKTIQTIGERLAEKIKSVY